MDTFQPADDSPRQVWFLNGEFTLEDNKIPSAEECLSRRVLYHAEGTVHGFFQLKSRKRLSTMNNQFPGNDWVVAAVGCTDRVVHAINDHISQTSPGTYTLIEDGLYKPTPVVQALNKGGLEWTPKPKKPKKNKIDISTYNFKRKVQKDTVQATLTNGIVHVEIRRRGITSEIQLTLSQFEIGVGIGAEVDRKDADMEVDSYYTQYCKEQ